MDSVRKPLMILRKHDHVALWSPPCVIAVPQSLQRTEVQSRIVELRKSQTTSPSPSSSGFRGLSSLANMDQFPQELIDRVTSFLFRVDLKNTLLVSRKFQYAAERASGGFAFFEFKKHTADEIQTFLTRFGGEGGRRFRYLRHVHVRTFVPPVIDNSGPLEELGPCRESRAELMRKDKMFTEQIKTIWNTFELLERTPQWNAGQIQMRIFTPTQWISPGLCGHREFSPWRVHLLAPTELPKLLSICALSICNRAFDDTGSERNCKLDLRVIIDLASSLPNLAYLGCKLGVDEWTDSRDAVLEHFQLDYFGCRRDTRNDFATALQSTTLPENLSEVQLDFINTLDASLQEQCKNMPNLVGSMGFDPFSSSLRLLSYSLRTLELHVVADKTLFWPGGNASPPTWPNLVLFSVLFHICSPGGDWYFESPLGEIDDDGDDDEDDDEDDEEDEEDQIAEEPAYPPFEDDAVEKEEWCFRGRVDTPEPECMFRVVPNNEHLVPFLAAFARAAVEMPKLLQAWLWAPVNINIEAENRREEYHEDTMNQYDEKWAGWGLTYDAPGSIGSQRGSLTSRRIRWRVGSWRPSVELHQSFQKIGENRHGSSLLETWHDHDDTGILPSRGWFEGGKYVSPSLQNMY